MIPLGVKHIQGIQPYRRRSAVYFLLNGDEVVYVGKTENLDGRIRAHERSNGKLFNSVWFRETPPELLAAVERAFIQQIGPKYNKRPRLVVRLLPHAEAMQRLRQEGVA